MNVRVLLFAGLKERVGRGECRLDDLAADGDVAALVGRLEARWPALAGYPYQVAVNGVLVDRDARLAEGDEVALLPPVSGG